MEVVNVTPAEFRKTMRQAAVIIGIFILLWRLPELLAVMLK